MHSEFLSDLYNNNGGFLSLPWLVLRYYMANRISELVSIIVSCCELPPACSM